MKTFPLMISKQFLKSHPRAGEPTYFKEKILNGLGEQNKDSRGLIYLAKIHTLRENYDHWARIANEVNAGRGVLSLRQWTGSPYNFQRDGSKPKEFLQLPKMGVQAIRLMTGGVVLNGKEIPWYEFNEIYTNDGFSYFDDFFHWFCPPLKNPAIGRVLDKQACIIHFTDFRYE